MTSDINVKRDTGQFDELVYRLGHDLRAPIRALRQLPDWISQDLAQADIIVPDSVVSNLSLIQNRMQRLDRLIEDLLVYSRVGRREDIRHQCVGAAISDAIANMTVPDGFHIETVAGEAGMDIGVADIRLLLHCLISNAVKHHDRDSGQIRVMTHQKDDAVTIVVEDDGPGIPAAAAQKVLEPMTTLRPRDQVEGSGMGLAIVERIARAYGGRVEISDRTPEPRGCRVAVRFPVSAAVAGRDT